MKDHEWTYQDILEHYGIHRCNAMKRFQQLGIKRIRRTSMHSVFSTDSVKAMAELVTPRTRAEKFRTVRTKTHSLEVMQLFFTLNDNRSSVIATRSGKSVELVSKIIDNYFIDGGVVMESKMNNPDFK